MQMVMYMKDNGKRIRHMVEVSITILMVLNTKETGLKINSMVME